MSRTVQTLQDAEVIINRLLNESDEVRKQLRRIEELARLEEADEIKIERKFFDIANEVEFMRELNIVVHRLHHKFKRIIVEGETRWYDFLGRTPAQWFTQFAVIDGPNKALYLRDESNNPIWEIHRRIAGGPPISDWLIYCNLLPPKTNPVTAAGYFNIGAPDFRWDNIYARRIDVDRPALSQPQIVARNAGVNPISLYSYDSNICQLIMGADATGNTFTAQASSAYLILKDAGGLFFFGNGGLTPGSVYSPTILWQMNPNEFLPQGDKNIGNASNRVATYFGKYMELDTPISDVNTQFVVKTGNVNGISLVSFDAATCGIAMGAVYTGGNWQAQSSTVVLLQKTTNSLGIYMNNGLGGGAFSPSLIWQFDASGNFIPGFGQSIGNTSFRVGTLYASNLNLSGGISTSSVINATGYQISGVTVIDSSRQFTGTNMGLTGPGNFAAQGYVQADGGFRVSGSFGQPASIGYTKSAGGTGVMTFTGGILTSFT